MICQERAIATSARSKPLNKSQDSGQLVARWLTVNGCLVRRWFTQESKID